MNERGMSLAPVSLSAYDSDQFGPLLGVSDEGSAIPEILRAARDSAKAVVAGSHEAHVLGLIVDGERMTSGGEAPIGPGQYLELQSVAAGGHAYCTTNVGIRVSARTDRPFPEIPVADTDVTTLADRVVELFTPFVKTPDGKPRPLLVRLSVPPSPDASWSNVRGCVEEIVRRRRLGAVGPADMHRLGLLAIFDGTIGAAQVALVERLVDLAAELGIPHVAIDGRLVAAAQARMGVQGVLNLLAPADARRLLAYSAERDVELSPRYTVDETSAAVGVWTGMQTARQFGLAGAKYGMTPLTFREQEHVVGSVQSWAELTAIPAFYADTPFVTEREVYLSDEAGRALQIWLDMVAGKGTEIVLVDCPDRIPPRIDQPGNEGPRPLVRSDHAPRGVFTLGEIGELTAHAGQLGIRILWSGGITRQAAFELGRHRVFGIFTTSSTARQIPVGNVLVADPQLPAEGEPSYQGVRQVHALLQAGFLCTALDDRTLAGEIEAAARPVMDISFGEPEFPELLAALDASLALGWKHHWSTYPGRVE